LALVSARGISDDVYVQIGLVMLIGLSAKNSILIVEFAEQQLNHHGKSIIEAAIIASELRLRPILMTSFAFILGMLPLCFATGAGAMGRHSVGTAVVGGMLFSTVLNLFFISRSVCAAEDAAGTVFSEEGYTPTASMRGRGPIGPRTDPDYSTPSGVESTQPHLAY